jgi:hypothetical protein
MMNQHNVLGMIGHCTIFTFTYPACAYIKSPSYFVTFVALNSLYDTSAALSYYVIVRDRLLANAGTALTIVIVRGILGITKALRVLGISGLDYSDVWMAEDLITLSSEA